MRITLTTSEVMQAVEYWLTATMYQQPVEVTDMTDNERDGFEFELNPVPPLLETASLDTTDLTPGAPTLYVPPPDEGGPTP